MKISHHKTSYSNLIIKTAKIRLYALNLTLFLNAHEYRNTRYVMEERLEKVSFEKKRLEKLSKN